MTTHDENHITRTSPKRFAKGLVIIVITLAVLGYITIAYWEDTASLPPPVSAPPGPPEVEPTETEPTTASPSPETTTTSPTGGPVLSIPMGAATPGNPAYVPATLTVSAGEVITVSNDDSAPHTVTSGTGPDDAQSGQSFDTGIIMAGETAELDTSGVSPGEHPYYCTVHPFMTGTLVIQ